MLAQNGNNGERLQRRHVAGASHYDVRLGLLVIPGPLPDADPFWGMRGGGVHCRAGCLPAIMALT